MAARRERERRRPPTEGRYRYATPEAALEPSEAQVRGDGDAQVAAKQVDGQAAHSHTQATHQPFSAYKAEYAYVFSDLRRVVVVIGSLLAILIVLNFVLPH
jgi:hypothetical protein